MSEPDVGVADLTFTRELPTTRRAIAYALERHGDQRRQADGAPFIVHPLEVAALLERSDYPDYVVAAAVLHDVLEDTGADSRELEARFGPDVRRLVALVSDDPSIADEEERKEEVRDRVRAAGGYAPVVYAADKVSKVRELRMLIAAGVEPDEVARKLARYEKSLAMVEEALPGSPLAELLRFEIEALETLPPDPEQREP
jgi:(p)ppGpp synthase/HD superfamily hydrolase